MYLMTSVSHFTKGGESVDRPLWLLLYQKSSRMELLRPVSLDFTTIHF